MAQEHVTQTHSSQKDNDVVWSLAELVQRPSAERSLKSEGPTHQEILEFPHHESQFHANFTQLPVHGERDAATDNKTRMPNQLKVGLEKLSGLDLSDVRVHYNSAKPAQLQASAYTQGQNIYVGPGQEKHLAHEGWHVVQQIQGKVKPTIQTKGVAINDDAVLEKEAEVMGNRAQSMPLNTTDLMYHSPHTSNVMQGKSWHSVVVQRNGAPTITHETVLMAPDGTTKSRTTVGVGETVNFTGSASGNWVATGGTASKNNDTKFAWTAPTRATTVTVKLTTAATTDNEASVQMQVKEPESITGSDKADVGGHSPGVAGAGMTLIFNYHPMNVSFGNVKAREADGDATNISGYFSKNFTKQELYHNSGETFTNIRANNKDSGQDKAAATLPDKPYEAGFFDWVIPNYFAVKGEGGEKKFTDVTQTFQIWTSGKVEITKAGLSIDRTP